MGAQGTATLDFGAFPGASDTSVAVAAAGVGAASLVEAWLVPTATAEHTADEHLVEPIRVVAGNVQAGVGFTIYGRLDTENFDPVEGSRQPMAYGRWTVGWVWN